MIINHSEANSSVLHTNTCEYVLVTSSLTTVNEPIKQFILFEFNFENLNTNNDNFIWNNQEKNQSNEI